MAKMAQGLFLALRVAMKCTYDDDDGFKYQAMCMNAKYARNYCPFQTYEASILLRELMTSPNGYKKHFER